MSITVNATAQLSESNESIVFFLTKIAGGSPSFGVVDGNGFANPVVNSSPSIKVNGTTTVLTTFIPFGDSVYCPLPFTVSTSATVTVSASASWVTTADGDCQALTNASVNATGASYLPTFDATTKAMSLGYNVTLPNTFGPTFIYANVARQGTAWQTTGAASIDANDNITNLVGVCKTVVSEAGSPTGNPGGNGYVQAPLGTYTLLWDGASAQVFLSTFGTGTTVTQTASNITNTTNNSITYSVTSNDTSIWNLLQVSVEQNEDGPCDTRNIRLYYPGGGTNTFSNDTLRQVGSASVLRGMDAFQTNSSNITTYDQWTPASKLFLSGPVLTYNMSAVAADANADGYLPPLSDTEFGNGYALFTTTTPHGFVDGQTVTLNITGDTLNVTFGTTVFNLANYTAIVKVRSATTFTVNVGPAGGHNAVPAVLVGATVTLTFNNCMPVADFMTLCREANTDAWVNVPHAMTDAGVEAMAADAVAHLPTGSKLFVEYTNEHWNQSAAFQQSFYCESQGAISSPALSADQWYAKRSMQVHGFFETALQGVGRSGDLVRVFGSFWAGQDVTTNIVDYVHTNSGQIDRIAIAPYFDGGPSGYGYASIFGTLNINQVFDYNEIYLTRNPNYTTATAAHLATLQTHFPDAQVTCYEGGVESEVTEGSNIGPLCREFSRHPRLKSFLSRYFDQQESQGASEFCYFNLSGPIGDGFGVFAYTYPAFLGTKMVAGSGDGTDSLNDNRTDFEDLTQIVSVIGETVNYWETLESSTPAPGPSPTPNLEPLANHVWSNVLATHQVGDGTLQLLGATIGTNASDASNFLVGTRVTAVRGVGSRSEKILFIANVVDIDEDANTLTLGDFLEGTSDQVVRAGDTVEMRGTAGQWNDLINAISGVTTPVLAVGQTVNSATAGSVLYVDSGDLLAQDNTHFNYDSTNHRLNVSGLKVTSNPTVGYVLTSDSAGVGTWQSAASAGESLGIDVTQHGVDNTGVVDASAGINAIHDGLSESAIIYLPAGTYALDNPIRLWKNGVTLAGAGTYLTSLNVVDATFPAVILGLQPTSTDSVSVTSANRPDLHGVLDSTVAPTTGVAWGFATLGRQCLYGLATQFTLGTYNSPTGWDYLGTGTGLTIRAAFSGRGGALPVNYPLFGAGDFANSIPCSWYCFISPTHTNHMTVVFRLAGDAVNTNRVVHFNLGTLTGLIRVIFGWNYSSGGSFFATVNGSSVTPVFDVSGQGVFGGAKLEPQFHDAPFLVGQSGIAPGIYPSNSATDFNLYGLLALNVANATDPANDAARYLSTASSTLCFLDVTKAHGTERFMSTYEGSNGSTRMLIMDGDSAAQLATTGQTVRDLTIVNGSPGVLIHRSFVVTLERLFATGGRLGLATTKYINSYPIVSYDSTYGGTDASVSLYSTIGTMTNTTIDGGGNCVVRECQTKTRWVGSLFSGFGGDNLVSVVALFAGDDGCASVWEDPLIDNESGDEFSTSVFYVENGPRYPASLTIRGGAVNPISGLPVYTLVGAGSNSQSTIDVAGFVMTSGSSGTNPNLINVEGPSGQWVGNVNTCGSTIVGVEGSGAGGVTVNAALGSGLTIGETISSGASGALLYQSGSGTLTQDGSHLTYNGSTHTLSTPTVLVTPSSASQTGVLIAGAGSQTGDLFHLQTSGGSPLFKIDATGNVFVYNDQTFNLSLTGTINQDTCRDLSAISATTDSSEYCSFDSSAQMLGATNYNHFAAYQARQQYNGTGSLIEWRGFWCSPLMFSTGTTDSIYQFEICDAQGSGPVTNQIGIFFNALTYAASNFLIYSIDRVTPVYWSSQTQIGISANTNGANFGDGHISLRGYGGDAESILSLGYNTTGGFGWIQSANYAISSFSPLHLNPNGGSILTGSGLVGVNTSSPTAQLHATSSVTSNAVIVAQAIASQSAPLFEAQDSSGNGLGAVMPSGNLIVGKGRFGDGGSRLSVYGQAGGFPIVAIYNSAANPKVGIDASGATSFYANPATSGGGGASPSFNFYRTWWNGSSSVYDAYSFVHNHFGESADNSALQFLCNSGAVALALGQNGGTVAVGYNFPTTSTVTTLGQFHVRAGLATTVGSTVMGAAGQTADLQQWQNSSGGVLAGVNSVGSIYTNATNTSAILYLGGATDDPGDFAGMWVGQTTPTASNATFLATNSRTFVNSNSTTELRYGNSARMTVGNAGVAVGLASNATPTSAQQFYVLPSDPSKVGIVVQSAASQTANVCSYLNSSGSVVSGVNSVSDLFLSTTSGAPSDSPTINSVRYDPATNKLYVFGNAGWKSTTLS